MTSSTGISRCHGFASSSFPRLPLKSAKGILNRLDSCQFIVLPVGFAQHGRCRPWCFEGFGSPIKMPALRETIMRLARSLQSDDRFSILDDSLDSFQNLFFAKLVQLPQDNFVP